MLDLISEKSFDLENTGSKILSIQVTLDGFSFSVVDPQTNRLEAYKYTSLHISNETFIAQRLVELKKSEPLLQRPFGEVHLVYPAERFIVVPDSYFSEDESDIFSVLFSELPDRMDWLETRLNRFDCRLLFWVPENLSDSFHSVSEKKTIRHPFQIMTPNLPENQSSNNMVVYFVSNRIFVMLWNENQLLLANSFKTIYPADVIFYLTSVLKSREINLKETNLFLAGRIDAGSETCRLVQTYFPRQEFFIPQKAFELNKEVFLHSEHWFEALYM